MFGGLAIVGAYFAGAPPFEAGVLVAVGIGLVVYGLFLRKAWNDRIRADVERTERRLSDKP
jgi:hypothetical protein